MHCTHMRLWRTFIRLSKLFVRKLLPELCGLCTVSSGMFLMCAADRVGLLHVWEGAIPGWIKVSMTTVSLVTLSMNVRKLLTADTMLLFAAAVAPSGYVGLTFSFRRGGILFVSVWTAIGTTAVVLHPLYIATTLTSMREGDILMLSTPYQVRVWVLLKPIGDGRGLLASLGSPRVLSEKRLLRLNLPCMEIRVSGRMGILELVKLVSTTHAFPRDCSHQDELRVLVFSLQRPVRIVQRAWRRAHADPSFSMCHTRLLREATEIDDDMRQLCPY